MAIGDIVVDVCNDSDPDNLELLVAASKAYWTSPVKGYTLISDDVGRDFVRVFASKIENGAYQQGEPDPVRSGDVILVYQR